MTALANSETTQPSSYSDPITVTASAILKIYELMTEEGNLNLKLRIYVQGGGCSGFQYGFSFEEAANDDDIIIKKTLEKDAAGNAIAQDNADQPRICVLIDMLSKPYLQGAEVDYRKDINGERFIIRGNPNAKTTCGCGSSFSADTGVVE